MKLALYPEQEVAAMFSLASPYSALWLDMDSGKTVIALTVAKALLWAEDVSRVLVVAPKRPLEIQWPSEIEKWEDFRALTTSHLVGTIEARKRALENEADLTFISYDNLIWLVKHLKKKWPFDFVIFDESDELGGKKRWRAIRSIRKHTSRMLMMTGTPAPNGLDKIWHAIYLLDEGERLGKTKGIFEDRWFNKTGYMGYTLEPKLGTEEDIPKVLSDIVLSIPQRKEKDVKALPEFVTLPAPAMAQYKQIEKEFYLELDIGVIEPHTAGDKSNKMHQFANGAPYVTYTETSTDRPWRHVHSAKLKGVDRIIKRHEGEPILVAPWFKPDLEILRSHLPHGEALTDSRNPRETVDRWNNREIPLMFIHPLSGGRGLNLQFGGRILVWFSLTFNLRAQLQLEARLPRKGQEGQVLIYSIVARNTIDEDIVIRQQTKRSVQDVLFSRLQKLKEAA